MHSEQTEPAWQAGFSERGCRVLAGVDVGFAGAIAVLIWLLIHSRLAGEWWWAKFNVAGGFFFGTSVYSMGPGRATLAGGALLLVLYTFAGVLYAQFAPYSGHARNALLALSYSAATCFAADRWLWTRFDPFALSYFPLPVVMAGHMLYALALLRFPSRFRSLAVTFGNGSFGWQHTEVAPTPAATDSSQMEDSSLQLPGDKPRPDIVEGEADRLE